MGGMAFGLGGIASHVHAMPFIDIMKRARPMYANDTSTVSGARTDAAGYAEGVQTVNLASVGTGSIPTNGIVTFSGDSTLYLVTSGDADVSNGGSISFEKLIGGGGLAVAIPAATTAITMQSFAAYPYEALVARGYVDENGWPDEVPPGMNGFGTIWDWGSDTSAPIAQYRTGTYVVTYEGTGTLAFSGATLQSSEAGRRVYTITGGTLQMSITSPGGGGDHMRNIKIFRQEHEELLDEGEILNPDYIDLLERYDTQQVRFMNMMATNNSDISEWADRPTVNVPSYTSKGIPVEVLVEIANRLNVDPWFTFPIQATDEYVTEFTTYVRDHLNSWLCPHFELGNENWNSAFDQLSFCIIQGRLNGGEFDPFGNEGGWTSGGDFAEGLQWAGRRSAQHMEIIRDVYGEDSGDRWKGELATWPASPVVHTGNLLTGVAYHISNDAGVPVGTTIAKLYSFIATTTYFGSGTVVDSDQRNELLDYLDTHTQEETFEWYKGRLLDPTYEQGIPDIVAQFTSLKATAVSNGLDISGYEGGQHVHHSFATGVSGPDLAALDAFMSAFVLTEQMADLYVELWDEWAAVTESPFMHFIEWGSVSTSGSWGLVRFPDDTQPRVKALAAKVRDLPYRANCVPATLRASS